MVERRKRTIDFEKLKSASKMPPAAPEVEIAILGAILIDSPMFAKLNFQETDGEIFFDKKNRIVYDGMYELFKQNIPIDTITLYRQLEKTAQLEDAGGAAYISKLSQDISSSANTAYHLALVRDKYHLRKIIATNMDVANSAYEGTEDPFDLATKEIAAMSKIAPTRLGRIHTIGDYGSTVEKNFNVLVERKGKPLISMGYEEIDEITHGVRPGELTVIAARSKHGKTTLSLNVAYKIIKPDTQNKTVLYFSYEADPEPLSHKLWAMLSGLDSAIFRYNKDEYTPLQLEKTKAAQEQVKNLKFFIDTESRDHKSVVASVAAVKSACPDLSLVVFDNIQNFNSNEKYRNDASVYKEITQVLYHDITKNERFGVHTVVLNQIDDWVEVKKINKYQIPLSPIDIADHEKTGIFNVADNVIFLTRPEVNFENPKNAPGVLKDRDYLGKLFLISNKARNNTVNLHTLVPLEFDAARSRIKSYSPEDRKKYTIQLDI
ncbi:MAG: DnaB-like helicase C-terminal domain-containing protein [Candidatus Woesearchaeota archaeon]